MRKPAFCILCKNKGADHLRGNCTADWRFCFPYIDSTILLVPKSKMFKPLPIFCGCTCTAHFVSDLVENS